MEKSLNVSSVATVSDGNKTKEVNKKLSRYKDIVELWKGFEIESSADLESHLENSSVLVFPAYAGIIPGAASQRGTWSCAPRIRGDDPVRSAKSENTISKYIGKAKRKKGYRQAVIDVSENPSISNEEARGMIANCLRRRTMTSVLMVNHKGEVEVVYILQ